MRLQKGQHVKMRCVAFKNIARFHAKHNPTGTSMMRYRADITINDDAAEFAGVTIEQKREIVRKTHTGIFDLEEIPGTGGLGANLVITDITKCDMVEDTVDICDDLGIPGYITFRQIPDIFDFRIESTGCRRPESIAHCAFKVWEDKLRTFGHDMHTYHRELMQEVGTH